MSTVLNMPRTHQHLIDARLDGIERMLLESRVSRGERAEIIQAVETQIFEMLEMEEGDVTREDVLRVLGSLDPPEAYCSDEPYQVPVRDSRPPRQAPNVVGYDREQPVTRRTSPVAIAAFVLSLLSIPTMIVLPLGALFGLAGAICGVVAISQISGSHGRLSGRWMAIFGCTVCVLHQLAIWALLFAMM